MAQDSFIREVNEELRQEKAKALWGRYGPLLILAAIIIVLATAAFQIFSYWQDSKSSKISDGFLEALKLEKSASYEDALKKLDEVVASNFGAYPALAQLRKADILLQNEDFPKAVAAFDMIAQNKQTPEILQKIANIRAAYILVDIGTVEDVEKRVKDLATDIDNMRISAREALGLAYFKAEKYEDAAYYFQKNADESVKDTRSIDRANIMLEVMKGRGNVAVKE